MKFFCLFVLILWCSTSPPACRAEPDAWQITHLQMISSTYGWAIAAIGPAYHVLHTSDGGKRWADVSPPGFAVAAPNRWNHDIYDYSVGSAFISIKAGWVAVVGVSSLMFVYHTLDSGRRWKRTQFPVSDVGDRVNIQFLDRKHGFILALGGPATGHMPTRIYRTTDGGDKWHLMNQELGAGFYPSGMTFRSTKQGWVGGSYHGTPDVPFFHTYDAGKTWQTQTLPIPALYHGGYANPGAPEFFGKNNHQGIFVARLVNHTSQRGDREETAIFVTRTSGKIWHYRKLPTSWLGLSDDCFVDIQHGWVLNGDAKQLYTTQNGGRTWKTLTTHFNQ